MMHRLLEEYLGEVEGQLDPLPVARRNEELREMRQHLLNAVIVNREMGEDEEAAARTATEQFGPPQEWAGSVVGAWRRGQRLKSRGLWGSASLSLGLSFLLPFLPLWDPVVNALNFLGVYGHYYIYYWSAPDVVAMALHALAGLACGRLFPRQAMAGVALGAGAWYLLTWAMMYSFFALDGCGYVPWQFAPQNTISLIAAVLAAWAGSSVQGARARQAGLVGQ